MMSSFFTMFQLYGEAENNYSLITKNYSLVTYFYVYRYSYTHPIIRTLLNLSNKKLKLRNIANFITEKIQEPFKQNL